MAERRPGGKQAPSKPEGIYVTNASVRDDASPVPGASTSSTSSSSSCSPADIGDATHAGAARSMDGMSEYFDQALRIDMDPPRHQQGGFTRDWRCVSGGSVSDRFCVECSSQSALSAERGRGRERDNDMDGISRAASAKEDESGVAKRRKSLQKRIKKFSLPRQSRKSSPSPNGGKQKPQCGGKSKSWGVFRFTFGNSKSPTREEEVESSRASPAGCVCTAYRRVEDGPDGNGPSFAPVIDLSKFNPDEYPIEDFDERARIQRAREIDEGIDVLDPPPGFVPFIPFDSATPMEVYPYRHLGAAPTSLAVVSPHSSSSGALNASSSTSSSVVDLPSSGGFSRETRFESFFTTTDGDCTLRRTVHTQVDYVHCLVPDLLSIANFPFYWGKMDRYEAERLLDNKQEGTFLLRDSAQDDYFFSVSFRRYGRSLHARIEQWNHMFSFDSHDPGVFSAPAVTTLVEHYKDPSSCMFFEPLLTAPLNRNFAFPLQHLCRAVICTNTTYDGIGHLTLPKQLKAYLREYHYKQKIRYRQFQVEH